MTIPYVNHRVTKLIVNNGKGITVARNIAVAPSYPLPPTVKVDTSN